MAEYDAPLNEDVNDKLTSARWNEAEDRWEMDVVIVEGDPSSTAVATGVGAPADAAVTDPTSSGSIIAVLKGLLTFLRVSTVGVGKAEDAAHQSGDTGVMALSVRQDTAAALAGTTGDYQPLTTNVNGRLRTINRAEEVAPTNSTSAALEANRIVKASAGTLYGFQGIVDTAAGAGWVQVFDAATATGTPKLLIPMAAGGGPFSLDLGYRGRAHATGIVIAFSSTMLTHTSPGSYLFVDAQYE